MCALRTPNLLSADKVQAALECAKDTQLRLTWREARGAPSAQAGKQHEDANLAELLLQLSSTLADISAAAGCFKGALGCVACCGASTCLVTYILLPLAQWCCGAYALTGKSCQQRCSCS